VSLSTESERAHIIERYKAEIVETPMRRKMYHDAVQLERLDSASSSDSESDVGAGSEPEGSTVSSGQTSPVDAAIESPENAPEPISGSTTISPPLAEAIEAHHEEEHENAAFVREMELAMKLSLEEYEQTHPAKNE